MEQKTPALIAITGWPCGGKSSGMASLVVHNAQLGIETILVPEAATLLMQQGIKPGKTISFDNFQDYVLVYQNFLEAQALQRASQRQIETGKQVVVLTDRGNMDGEAYVSSRETYDAILAKHGLNRAHITKIKYSGVIHLVTAPEEHYTCENNLEREETREEAKVLDQKTQEARAWSHLKIIPNRTNFKDKMDECTRALQSILGVPVTYEHEDKFAVTWIDMAALVACNPIISHITQDYIQSPRPDEIWRVRKLEQWGTTIYYRTMKKQNNQQETIEHESLITEAEYTHLLTEWRLPDTTTIEKERYCFAWNDQHFEFDIFTNPTLLQPWDVWLLEIEKVGKNDPVFLPSFMKCHETTNNPHYKNAVMAWALKHHS